MKDVTKGIIISILISIPIIYLLSKVSKKTSKLNYDIDKSGRKLVIGDSHAKGIGTHTSGVEVDTTIAVGGWKLSDLYNALQTYPIKNDVSAIFISIGTNGLFSSSDKIENLVTLIKQKFPNAKLFAFRGSYGWAGSLSVPVLKQRQTDYYNRMKNAGVIILKNGLDYFADGGEAHTTSTLKSKAIIKEIEQIVN